MMILYQCKSRAGEGAVAIGNATTLIHLNNSLSHARNCAEACCRNWRASEKNLGNRDWGCSSIILQGRLPPNCKHTYINYTVAKLHLKPAS